MDRRGWYPLLAQLRSNASTMPTMSFMSTAPRPHNTRCRRFLPAKGGIDHSGFVRWHHVQVAGEQKGGSGRLTARNEGAHPSTKVGGRGEDRGFDADFPRSNPAVNSAAVRSPGPLPSP